MGGAVGWWNQPWWFSWWSHYPRFFSDKMSKSIKDDHDNDVINGYMTASPFLDATAWKAVARKT